MVENGDEGIKKLRESGNSCRNNGDHGQPLENIRKKKRYRIEVQKKMVNK